MMKRQPPLRPDLWYNSVIVAEVAEDATLLSRYRQLLNK